MVTPLFFTLHDFTKSQSIRSKKKPNLLVLTVIPSHIITLMSVFLIYTRDAFFFRFRCNSNDDSSVNSSLHASSDDGSGLHVQNTMSTWLVCVGQSTTLLSKVYQI